MLWISSIKCGWEVSAKNVDENNIVPTVLNSALNLKKQQLGVQLLLSHKNICWGVGRMNTPQDTSVKTFIQVRK